MPAGHGPHHGPCHWVRLHPTAAAVSARSLVKAHSVRPFARHCLFAQWARNAMLTPDLGNPPGGWVVPPPGSAGPAETAGPPGPPGVDARIDLRPASPGRGWMRASMVVFGGRCAHPRPSSVIAPKVRLRGMKCRCLTLECKMA